MLLIFILLSIIAAAPAQASELRVERPCQSSTDGGARELAAADKLIAPASVVAHFNQWKLRYAQPVFCPVALCHGSCGAFPDACILHQGVVLNSGGCSGSCK